MLKYTGKSLRKTHKAIEELGPRAIEYIEQAPVLTVMVTSINKFAAQVELGVKLPVLLSWYHVAVPLRVLHPQVLRFAHRAMIRTLWRVNPSTLAQAIPEDPQAQRQWIGALYDWHNWSCWRKMYRADHIEWLLIRSKEMMALEFGNQLSTLVDFANREGYVLNPAWGLDRAFAEADKWHAELQKATEEQKFSKIHNIEWDEPIEYKGLPLILDMRGYTFVALRSGKALWEEGTHMHNCVASYVSSMLREECWLYSIQKDGKRIATLELGRGRKVWRVVQVKGPYNKELKGPEQKAVEEFVCALNPP